MAPPNPPTNSAPKHQKQTEFQQARRPLARRRAELSGGTHLARRDAPYHMITHLPKFRATLTAGTPPHCETRDRARNPTIPRQIALHNLSTAGTGRDREQEQPPRRDSRRLRV
jgi:hypothetical protein